MNVLFLNHTVTNCGVYQYGHRLYNNSLAECKIFTYHEVASLNEYVNLVKECTYSAIIYNYHVLTMPWLNNATICKNVRNIGILHESPVSFFDITCDIDPNVKDTPTHYSLPRPIFTNVGAVLNNYVPSSLAVRDFINYGSNDLPIFGSFGFGFRNKGFDKIVQMVNDQYDHALIKFVIPRAHFDPNFRTAEEMRELCVGINVKSGIKLMISHDFFDTKDLLLFLRSNTLNIFLYDKMMGRGISSVIDYALSSGTPFGISDSYMFRNVYSDNICLYKVSLRECLETPHTHLKTLLSKYDPRNILRKFKHIIENSLSNSQAGQDLFALLASKHKLNGHFLEIGANDPVKFSNNTFMLDRNYGWTGIMVDNDKSFELAYRTLRPRCQYIIGDASKLDYANLLKKHDYPKNMDYLQIDLDVNNRSTLDTLELLNSSVLNEYKFATVTFEHDIYTGDWFNTRLTARDIFEARGYVLVFPDVQVDFANNCVSFEDWFVHPDLVGVEYAEKIKTSEALHFTQIVQILQRSSDIICGQDM